ncbi:MAG: T9SS type A sorting domain-containing protein [Ignavibacteria bacterium]
MKIIFVNIFLFCIIHSGISQTPVYKTGFPIVIDSNRSPYQKAGLPLITDFEKDGQKEIIFFTIDYFGITNPNYLYVTNNDGSNYPNFPKGYNELILDVNSGDVDGDGFLDIVLRFSFSFDVIDRFGNHLPGFPVNYSDGEFTPLRPINIYDLDNDGKLEIIVSKKGELSVFNYNGTLRQGWPRYIPGSTKTNAAIGDIDNDGIAEIIAATVRKIPTGGSDSSALRIFRENGENFSNEWPVYSDSLYENSGASPTLIINRNFTDSTYILMSTKRTNIGGISNNRLTKFNIYGQIIDRGYANVLNGLGTIVIGDLDRDGKPEYSNGAQGDPYLLLYSNELVKLSGWPNEGVGEHWATPLIGKLTHSNNLNVTDNNWSAFAPNGFGNVFAYNKDGSPLPWSPLRPEGIVEGIALSDIDNNGSVELIATSSKGYETYIDKNGSVGLTTTSSKRIATYLHIWSLDGIPFSHENFPWSMYGHDRYRTNQYGFIPPDEPVGILPISNNVPDKFSLYQNFPNPFNPTTNIKFDLINSGNVSLKIYDALGREISTLVNERLNIGTYQIVFDGNNFTSGIYFYSIETENFRETKKFILLK